MVAVVALAACGKPAPPPGVWEVSTDSDGHGASLHHNLVDADRSYDLALMCGGTEKLFLVAPTFKFRGEVDPVVLMVGERGWLIEPTWPGFLKGDREMTGEGPLVDDRFIEDFAAGGAVTLIYGRQRVGPYPPLPENLRRTFVDACRQRGAAEAGS